MGLKETTGFELMLSLNFVSVSLNLNEHQTLDKNYSCEIFRTWPCENSHFVHETESYKSVKHSYNCWNVMFD